MIRVAAISFFLGWSSLLSLDAYSAESGGKERIFLRALELFDNAKSAADYQAAAAILESISADGFRNGAVYYNLGNAYFRAGEYGRAILNYRKAIPYRPRDPYLRANLQQAMAASPGKLSERTSPWWNHVFFWRDWLSFPFKAKLLAMLLCAIPISVLAAVFLRRHRLYWLSLVLGGISLALGTDVAIQYNEVFRSKRAVIVGETIARKGTGNSYEAAFDQPLRDGAEFEILSETPDWTFGHFQGIGDGWVRNEFVAK